MPNNKSKKRIDLDTRVYYIVDSRVKSFTVKTIAKREGAIVYGIELSWDGGRLPDMYTRQELFLSFEDAKQNILDKINKMKEERFYCDSCEMNLGDCDCFFNSDCNGQSFDLLCFEDDFLNIKVTIAKDGKIKKCLNL